MDRIEKKIIDLIDQNREKIVSFANDIYNHGELGYKEFRTSAKFKEVMEALNLRTVDNLAITGVKGYLNEDKKDHVSLALIGELDALRIPSHAHANPETQGAHCCGHHAQLTGVIGAALALTDPEVAAALDGQVVFFAVPAEEYGEIEFKNQLAAEGKILYGGGKCELIRVGAFDDIDLSLAHHSKPGDQISLGSGTNNGFVSQVVRFKGRESHAASSPDKGVNALNAASLALAALAFQRETFRDEDHVRVHPIMTRGGDLVNVVPGEAVIESLIRAKNVAAIEDAWKKTTRAMKAGADALGAGYEITTMPGYLPALAQPASQGLIDAAHLAAPDVEVVLADPNAHSGGSTDVGDLQHIQPVMVFNTGGIRGSLHSTAFEVVDEELAYVTTAKIFALAAYRLLRNGAAEAKQIRDEYKPIFTKEEYLNYMNSKIKTEKKEVE